jgi:hypothetical protein
MWTWDWWILGIGFLLINVLNMSNHLVLRDSYSMK